jgi:hypothetical protein
MRHPSETTEIDRKAFYEEENRIDDHLPMDALEYLSFVQKTSVNLAVFERSLIQSLPKIGGLAAWQSKPLNTRQNIYRNRITHSCQQRQTA